MKKLILLCTVVFIFISCSMDDGRRVDFTLEFIPVTNVTVPEYFERGQTYDITVTYKRPTDCHYFDGFYYDREGNPSGNVWVVAAQAIVLSNFSCESLSLIEGEQASFQFICDPQYAHNECVFKFFEGEDEDGNQRFREVVVPVAE